MDESSHGGNPIQSDAEMQMLVKKLDRVKKYQTFQRWKGQFLGRLEKFLYEQGMDPAEASSQELEQHLQKLVSKTTKVLDFIHKGDLGEDKKTVKSSLALNEMCNTLEKVRVEIETLIPSLKQEEKKLGYSKFHLGAALIRQGFPQYISMKAVEDAVKEIAVKLENVADRQQHDLFQYYQTQVQRFCDVMADLNLYAIMMKCIQFSTPPGDDDESEEPEYVQIVVECKDDGRKLPMEVDTQDPVLSIQEGIEAGLDIPIDRQILSYQGQLIDDTTKTMEGLGVQDGAVFVVQKLLVPISVRTPTGDTIELKVDPSQYVSDLKRQLEPESKIPAKNQTLSKDAIKWDNPSQTLEGYGVEPGMILDLEPKTILVNVEMPDGKTTHQITVVPNDDDTPALKNKIEQVSGMAVPRQVLKYQGDILLTDGMSCKDMGIVDGSTLQVDIFKIPIQVSTPDGNPIEIRIEPTQYLSDLKRILEPKSGIPAKNQNLSREDGGELDDLNKKIEDYGLEAGTALDLEPKTIQVHVEMHDGKTFQIEVSPKDETPAIKDKIAQKSGVAVPRQVVKHQDDELPSEGQSCKDMGIQDGSILNVSLYKIPIKVNTPDGNQLQVQVEPSNYLSDLKRLLEPESGISAKNQNLSQNGEELEDLNKKIADYGLEPGAVLDVEPRMIKVNVETPDGKTYEIELSPKDDSPTIKKKIEDVSGVAVPRQVVAYNGEELPTEGKSCKDMGVQDGSTLNLDIFKVPIKVNTPEGDPIELMVEPTGIVSDLKEQLEIDSGIPKNNQYLTKDDGEELADPAKTLEGCGIEAGTTLDLEPKTIKVNVETPDGKTHEIELTPKKDTPTIKNKIEDIFGVAVPRQVVRHNGEELPAEGKSCKDMGIKDGSTLNVGLFKIPVKVNTPDGNQAELMVEPLSSISDLKQKLVPESGIPESNQNLFKDGEELDDPAKTLQDFGIETGTILDLEPKAIKVNVEMPDGNSHEMELSPRDDTSTIKNKVEQVSGVAVPRQVVKHEGDELPAQGASCKHMGIKDGSTLNVDLFKIPVKVNAPDDNQIELMVEPSSSISDLKRQLEPESGIPEDNQHLSKGGEELSDPENTLEDCGIEAGSSLDLEPKIIKVNVETPDGKLHEIELSPKDDTPVIKKKIEEVSGVAMPRQVVKYHGKELPQDGSSCKVMGIKDGSTLQVEFFKFPVKVNAPDGNQIEVMVEPTSSISDVKRILEHESGIPESNQNLSKDGGELDDPAKTLQDCDIGTGTTLDLEPKLIKVDVEMPDGRSHQIELAPRDETPTIKNKIEEVSGMSVPRQVVKYNDEELTAEGKSCKDMGIKDGSTLSVGIYKVPIEVNMPDGKQLDLMVEPTNTLSDLKRQLEPEAGIPESNQNLSMDGDELFGPEKSLQDCGIKAGSKLDLEPKTIKVNVEMPDGTLHQIEVSPRDETPTIKNKIAEVSGVTVPRQVVKYYGEELPPEGVSCRGMGIMDGSILNVEIFKVLIKVNTPDGSQVELMVEPSSTVSDLKKQLEPESGIPESNQNLSLGDSKLDDPAKSLEYCGVEVGTVLDLGPKIIKVNAEMPDGTSHEIELSPNDETPAIRKKIEEKSGVAAPRQVVKHDGDELSNNGKSCKDMGIKDGSTLQVDLFKVPIKVNTPHRDQVELMVEPTSTVSDLKKQLASDSGIPEDNQNLSRDGEELAEPETTLQNCGIEAGTTLDLAPKVIKVNVEMPDGGPYEIEVSPKDETPTIKKKIEEISGVAVPRQVVKYNGEELPAKGASCKEMGIQDGSTLNVDIFKIPIKVNVPEGNQIDLMVEPCNNLSELKKQLEPQAGIPEDNQKLSMGDKEMENPGKELQDYGVEAGSILDLQPRNIKVDVGMPDGETKSVEISPSDDGKAIKEKIEKQTGLEAPRQVLSFDGQEVPHTESLAKDLDIKDGSKLEAKIFKMPVTVNVYDGTTIQIMVEPTEPLSAIKSQLASKSGIQQSNQVLSKSGKELVGDDKTAKVHGIKGGTILDLEPKTIKVTATMPNGKEVELEIAPSDGGNAIKKKIDEETGMEVPRQVLNFNGKEIPNTVTAREAGLRDGSKLDVDIVKVPVSVTTWDDKLIEIMVDPTDKLIEIKNELEAESGIAPSNQILYKKEVELFDNNKRANAYGIKGGTSLYLEPKYIGITVVMPNGSKCTTEVTADTTGDDIKDLVAKETNVAAQRQVLHFQGKEVLADSTVRGMGIKDKSTVQCTLFKIPITVETKDGKAIPLHIEPIEPIDGIKQSLEKPSGLAPRKQVLKFVERELDMNQRTATDYGIRKGSVLQLEPKDDPIVFVDCKCGSLFGVDRDEVIDRGMLTPNQGNALEFSESEKSSFGKDKLLKAMLDSPNLGVKPQIVIEKLEVEDYDLAEAEGVKSRWGVQLKKTQKSKRGQEFIFVDLKTGAFGLLDRQQAIDKGFITPIGHGKDESIKEAEQQTRVYDRYVHNIRTIFGVKTAN